MSNRKRAAKSPQGAYDGRLADEWRNLASEFLRAADDYDTGKNLRLVYKKADSVWPDGFVLMYVQPDPANEGEEIEAAEPWEHPATMESTFRNLAARGLRLANRDVSSDIWRDWAEFLVAVLPWHREELRGMVASEKDGYVKSARFYLVDNSVYACQELEFENITGLQPERPLVARGLRAVRASHIKHYSQEGLAEVVGCCRESISRWENDEPISRPYLDRICAALECHLQDILGER